MASKKPRVAYTIPVDEVRRDLEVLHSANAWWMNRIKVEQILQVFAVEGTIEEACFYANITRKQYKYFALIHPVISEIRADFKTKILLGVRRTVMAEIGNNYKTAMWYLEMRLPEEFALPSRRKHQKPQTGMGTPITLLITDYSKASTSSENSITESQLD